MCGTLDCADSEDSLEILDFLDTKSFWSMWYWIATMVTWSMTSHWTIGVPYDAIMRAERQGGVFEEHCDTLVDINVHRLTYYFDTGGVYLAGFVCFLLAVISTLGFGMGVELFMALFMLAAPLSLVMAFSLRFAYRVKREGWRGEVLRKKLRWRRLWNQVIGMCAITATTVVSVFYYLYTIGYFVGLDIW